MWFNGPVGTVCILYVSIDGCPLYVWAVNTYYVPSQILDKILVLFVPRSAKQKCSVSFKFVSKEIIPINFSFKTGKFCDSFMCWIRPALTFRFPDLQKCCNFHVGISHVRDFPKTEHCTVHFTFHRSQTVANLDFNSS